jgi:acyl-CoA thioester hydrolase
MPRFKGSLQRRLQFYETDAMGIIHHANYLRFMEEARMEFLLQLPNKSSGDLLTSINYPLVHCHVDYKKPLRLHDELELTYQVWIEGARLCFNYEFLTKSFANPVAFGKTIHAAFDMKSQRAVRLPQALVKFLTE